MIIVIAFIAIAALLLWLLIGARGHWALKLVLIVAVIAYMFTIWHGIKSYEGWPTSIKPPTEAYYIRGYAVEPDPENHIKGAIYVWLIPFKPSGSRIDYKSAPGEPRAYKLPYSEQLEGTINTANKEAGSGKAVVLKKGKSKTNKHGLGGATTSHGQYKAYVLPPPSPPTKSSSP